MVTIALSKGRLAEDAKDIFEKSGLDCSGLDMSSRKLIFENDTHSIQFFLVKPADVPTYVEYGAADIGVVGKDTLLEENRDLYKMLDLKFGKCKLAVAGYPEKKDSLITNAHLRVATKYTVTTKQYFQKKGEHIDIIKLNGSVELGPITDLSDVIVDIVESGKTLKENGLVVLEDICDISARLVVNKASLKTKQAEITHIINSVEKALEE
jgi:ATP phosphoribosyltransferase